jgi:DNA mismatch repair protein MutS
MFSSAPTAPSSAVPNTDESAGSDEAVHVSPAVNLATPVMRQYLEVKERYADCIVFFRLGDFYEMFYDDAVVASQLLDLTLTARDKQRETPVPMCGVPYHAARHYIAKLITFGKKVAICDQVEDARKTKKIVRRAVTQVITPGVILEEEQLEPKAGHYLAALCLEKAQGEGESGKNSAGIAYLDVSTGEFAATAVPAADALEELARIDAAELLIVAPPGQATSELSAKLHKRLRVPIGQSRDRGLAEDRALLAPLLGPENGEVATALSAPAAAAAAACMRYAQATQPAPGGNLPLYRLRLYRPGESLIIDDTTRQNLELLQTLMERKRQGALIWVIDQTKTAMGGRLLRRWLLQPLQDLHAIRRRHDAVEWLVDRQAVRQALRERLGEIYDLERLAGRLGAQVATPRDLYSLQKGLEQLPLLVEMIRAAQREKGPRRGEALGLSLPELLDLGADLGQDVAARIAAAIADNPPALFREGGFIRRGYSARLDECVDLSQGGKDRILAIEERERERSGISSLKVRYNKVFGYYIEITKSHLAKVPADYVRKQTTANAERYVTSELAEYEATVLGAEEKRVELELELFEQLKQELLGAASRLLPLAERVAQLDALSGLAEVAHRNDYVRPTMTGDLRLHIEDGRHPVVEQMAERGKFVPNDTLCDPDAEQLLILTGPNMAGKSTVMRQVALITVLAQMGSFVPARRAEIGVVDRVCTRVGASDNLSRGESTFMVEMRETSQILGRATRRSLIILDEIGRGTSTYDGVSIAWAVAEFLHDTVGCKTLFATHYHELAALAEARPRVRNFSIAVRHWQGEIVFLHKLIPGGANRSYGIEVARLAGLPKSVVERARQILADLESVSSGGLSDGGTPVHGMPCRSQLPLFLVTTAPIARPELVPSDGPKLDPASAEVLKSLRDVDCDDLSPRQALELVSKLKSRLKNG